MYKKLLILLLVLPTAYYSASGQSDTCSCQTLQQVIKAGIETYRDLKICEVERDSSIATIKDLNKKNSLKDSIIKNDSLSKELLLRENEKLLKVSNEAVREKKKLTTWLKVAGVAILAETTYILIRR